MTYAFAMMGNLQNAERALNADDPSRRPTVAWSLEHQHNSRDVTRPGSLFFLHIFLCAPNAYSFTIEIQWGASSNDVPY